MVATGIRHGVNTANVAVTLRVMSPQVLTLAIITHPIVLPPNTIVRGRQPILVDEQCRRWAHHAEHDGYLLALVGHASYIAVIE